MGTVLHATPLLDSRFFSKIDLYQHRVRIPPRIFPQKKSAAGIMKKVLTSASVSMNKSKSNSPETTSSHLEPVDPYFYKHGAGKYVSFFGVEFKEGPDGIGLFAVGDLPHLPKPRVILEIPMELMLTVSKNLPWMFYPNVVPFGHPIFDIINSTHPETDWDLRLACVLLLAFDTKGNFWQFYGDFLPGVEEGTNLLLAAEEELIELQDQNLASFIRHQQERVTNFWKKNWHADVPWKLKRLAPDPERFLWAVSIAQTRCINLTMVIGAKVQEANMLIPYADMINHSFQPTCSFRWRKKDRMLEVLINAGQSINAGDEMTISYLEKSPNDQLMARYGFSTPMNPWESIEFSETANIHLDSFLSAFSLSGLMDELYHNGALDDNDKFVDGGVIAAARNLPTWSEGDLPFLPSVEKDAARKLKLECMNLLQMFPTTLVQDIMLEAESNERSKMYRSALKYRIHRKTLIRKIIRVLTLYPYRLLF